MRYRPKEPDVRPTSPVLREARGSDPPGLLDVSPRVAAGGGGPPASDVEAEEGAVGSPPVADPSVGEPAPGPEGGVLPSADDEPGPPADSGAAAPSADVSGVESEFLKEDWDTPYEAIRVTPNEQGSSPDDDEPVPLPPNLTARRRGTLSKRPFRRGPALSAEQKLLLLDTWLRSGLPARDFGALVNVSRHTLYAWKRRFEQLGPAGLMVRVARRSVGLSATTGSSRPASKKRDRRGRKVRSATVRALKAAETLRTRLASAEGQAVEPKVWSQPAVVKEGGCKEETPASS